MNEHNMTYPHSRVLLRHNGVLVTLMHLGDMVCHLSPQQPDANNYYLTQFNSPTMSQRDEYIEVEGTLVVLWSRKKGDGEWLLN